MELKSILIRSLAGGAKCSNRTFMELKFYLGGDSLLCYLVLIAPLWN